MYDRARVYEKTLEYFNNDTLATDVWINKYCLKDYDGNFYEETPEDMHRRIAKEFFRIEQKYSASTLWSLSEDQIFELLDHFKYIIPQGSPMAGIGNNLQTVSLGNCFVVGNEFDSYSGIMKLEQEMVQLMKRRGGVGLDLSHIRPKGTKVNNAAISSTGVVPFMNRFSHGTREVAQDGRRGALMLTISCFSESTIILTNEGWINVVDIVERVRKGDIIYALSETCDYFLITNPVKRPPEQLYDLELEDGSIITVTEDHEFEVLNIKTNEVYLKKLKYINEDFELLKVVEEDTNDN